MGIDQICTTTDVLFHGSHSSLAQQAVPCFPVAQARMLGQPGGVADGFVGAVVEYG